MVTSGAANHMTGPRPVAYLAGPMRGIHAFNYSTFAAVANHLRSAGYAVIDPAAHDLETWPTLPEEHPEAWAAGQVTPPLAQWVQRQFRWDLCQLLDADLVVLLPGWERSVGAQLEAALAYLCGIPVHRLAPNGALIPATADVAEVIEGLR